MAFRLFAGCPAPGPAQTLVFIDERDDSIDDGFFAIDMTTGSGAQMVNFPASYHNGAAGLSFADGHVQSHHWQASKKFHGYQWAAAPGADLRDLRYVQSVIPRLR